MKNNNIKSVCVFASSSDFLEKSYYKDAARLGELLAAAGMDMVYNMDDKNPELVCESDGEYGEDITGFSLYVFSSQQASSSNVVGYWSLFTSMTKLTR